MQKKYGITLFNRNSVCFYVFTQCRSITQKVYFLDERSEGDMTVYRWLHHGILCYHSLLGYYIVTVASGDISYSMEHMQVVGIRNWYCVNGHEYSQL